MFESPPKMKNAFAQKWADKGFEAAKAGKPLSAIDDEPDLQGWVVAPRFAWIRGWEGGGGDIFRKIVVTERERLQERRLALITEMGRIDARLKELSDSAGDRNG